MDKLLAGRRVLVVEDEMLILLMIEDMLADLGCEAVTCAGTVDRALALINGQVFDAAMLDMNLNGNDCYLIADQLAARGVPFFFSTGNSGHQMKDGFSDRAVLRKPFEHEQLAVIFKRLLADRGGLEWEKGPGSFRAPRLNTRKADEGAKDKV